MAGFVEIIPVITQYILWVWHLSKHQLLQDKINEAINGTTISADCTDVLDDRHFVSSSWTFVYPHKGDDNEFLNLSAGESSGSPQFASRDQSNLGLHVQPPKEAARARFLWN